MFRYKSYVNEVYKEKSFSKAAENLYISQPSLSARIIKLEEELGMPIFDRSTSPLRLTEFGEVYMEALREVDAIERRIENYISDISHLRTGKLTIGASNVFAAYVIPPLISKFQKRYPEVKIRLIEGNTETLEALLATSLIWLRIIIIIMQSFTKERCMPRSVFFLPCHAPLRCAVRCRTMR